MSEEHSPLPWAIDPDDREGMEWNSHIVQQNAPHMRVCFMTSDGPSEANAALIVRSVNALPDLVKALEEISELHSALHAREIAKDALEAYRSSK